ncbi:hypothetical protein L1887_16420 [Cichorium endivia]|nr:hypothetical protein L1887_16420 [Cichorium endivia]
MDLFIIRSYFHFCLLQHRTLRIVYYNIILSFLKSSTSFYVTNLLKHVDEKGLWRLFDTYGRLAYVYAVDDCTRVVLGNVRDAYLILELARTCSIEGFSDVDINESNHQGDESKDYEENNRSNDDVNEDFDVGHFMLNKIHIENDKEGKCNEVIVKEVSSESDYSKYGLMGRLLTEMKRVTVEKRDGEEDKGIDETTSKKWVDANNEEVIEVSIRVVESENK